MAVVAALGACEGSSEPPGPAATVPQGTTTTNPYAVPAVIDEAYVNLVLAGLDQAVGEVTRMIRVSQTIPRESVDRLSAIYLDADLLQLTVDIYRDDFIRGFEGNLANPGNRITTVTDLISASPKCIFAKVDADMSAIFERPNPQFRTQWIGLVKATTGIDPYHYNPTSWGYIYEGFTRDLTAPDDPCSTY